MNIIPYGSSGRILVSLIQMAGSRHQNCQQPCEDAVFLRVTGDFLFCGLADGQSGAAYGAEGGRACLEAIGDYLEEVGLQALLSAPFPDELPCTITRVFRRRLLALSQKNPWKDFASTLLAIAVDLKTGQYVLLHLGDGCALSVSRDTEPGILSGPEQGLSLHHTWLTTSDNAVSHLRLSFGRLQGRKRLLLLSDGAVCLCRGQNIPWRAKDLLKTGTRDQLHQYLLQSKPADDATCILLDCTEEG